MMYLTERDLEISEYQPVRPGRIGPRLLRWPLRCLLVGFLCYSFMQPALFYADSPLVIHEIRYHMPEAGEVFLVWGINGWASVPEETRPTGTVVDERGIMSTPIIRERDAFVVKVQVPPGASIDYGFWISKTRTGAPIEVWDTNSELEQDYHTVAVPRGVTGVKEKVILEQARASAGFLDVGLYLLLGLIVIFSIGITLYLVHLPNRGAVILALLGLTLLGLRLRLWLAWDTSQHLPNTFARLTSDEFVVDELANALRQGSLFALPTRASIYPVFLAGCYLIFGHTYTAVHYVQAFVGATAIILTFLLTRRFTGPKPPLLAAALIAIHPTRAFQVTRLSSEVLNTILLLAVAIIIIAAVSATEYTSMNHADDIQRQPYYIYT